MLGCVSVCFRLVKKSVCWCAAHRVVHESKLGERGQNQPAGGAHVLHNGAHRIFLQILERRAVWSLWSCYAHSSVDKQEHPGRKKCNAGRLRRLRHSRARAQVKDSTGDDVREGVRVSAADEVELPGSRGSAHFALKWMRDARHAAHLTLAPVKGVTRAYTGADDGKWVGVVGMECRGLEPVSWQPEVRPQGQAACGGTK